MADAALADTPVPASLLSRTLLREMAASALGGMVADGLTYPMCTIKNRLQVQGSGGGGYAYAGPLDAAATMVRREGLRSLWKGASTVLPVAPAQALYMGGYQGFRRSVQSFGGDADAPSVQLAGGVVATLTQSLVMVPLEVVRQRQQVQTAVDVAAGGYKGSFHALTTIAKVEGPAALYRGFGVTQLVWGPFNAIFLPLWEGIKREGVARTGVSTPAQLPLSWEVGAALGASAVAAAASNPMDVVKTRLQVGGASNISSTQRYAGAADAARAIWKAEGARGFARGCVACPLKLTGLALVFSHEFHSPVRQSHGPRVVGGSLYSHNVFVLRQHHQKNMKSTVKKKL